MNRRTFIISGIQLSSFAALGSTQVGQFFTYAYAGNKDARSLDIRRLFSDPPQSAKPLTLWHWMNGLVSREGITADLESFKAAGLAGVQVFLVGGSEMRIDDPKNQIMNGSWRELNRFAIQECARLGLEFGTHNSPGWSSTGYPTVTPEQSMQKIVYRQTRVIGNGQSMIELSIPQNPSGHYKDIKIYAIRANQKQVMLDGIVDLTANLSGNILNWKIPEGEWVIFRLGHTAMGNVNGTAPLSGQGLEIDKLSPDPLKDYWSTFPGKMIGDAGKEAGKSFMRFEIDSYEHGVQNWSANFNSEFKRRRGYDPAPYLLTLAGVEIQSAAHTERFRYDQKHTLRELFETNYFQAMQRLTHQVPGMELIIEPYSTGKEQPFDSSNAAAWGDLLMCEFWQKPTTWGWDSVKPTASAAHVWGKNLVAAEAFTGQPNSAWKVDPYAMKSSGDRAFAGGVNKLFFHTSAHQPWNNVYPGMTMGQWGTHFGRTQTWWKNGGKEWISYLSRCQFLLQSGLPVADLCYLTYDRITPAPIAGYNCDTIGINALLQRLSVRDGKLVLPNGVSYRVLILPNTTKMAPELLVKIAGLIERGATVIGPRPSASPSLENYPSCDLAVKTLAEKVWGKSDQAHHNYGKGNVYQLPEKEVLDLIKVQPDVDVIMHTGKQSLLWIHRAMTSGQHLYFLSNQEETSVNATVSFRVTKMVPELWDAYTGKTSKAVFFKSDSKTTTIDISLPPSGSIFVSFLEKSTQGEFIKSFIKPTGPASVFSNLGFNDGKFHLLAATEGKYLAETTLGRMAEVLVKRLPAVNMLDKDWELEFLHLNKSSERLKLDQLTSWTEFDTELKYFSGTVKYKNKFSLANDKSRLTFQWMLDLGSVKNTVAVAINGRPVITLWAPPFILDVTKFLNHGENSIELEVTNLWANRLIGDEQYPEDLEWNKKSLAKIPQWVLDGSGRNADGRQTFATYKFFKKEDKLLQSGLLGPVKIYALHQEVLNLT